MDVLVSKKTPQKPDRLTLFIRPATRLKFPKSTFKLSPQLKAMLRGVLMIVEAMPYCLKICAKA